MKIVTASNGKRTLNISRNEWKIIGEKNGWIRKDTITKKCGINDFDPSLTKAINDLNQGLFDSYLNLPPQPDNKKLPREEFIKQYTEWQKIRKAEYDKRTKELLRKLKSEFSNKADRKFLESLKTIHWGHLDNIIKIVNFTGKELSTIGYKSPPYFSNWLNVPFGLMIKGFVTLANSGDSQSNQWIYKDKSGTRTDQKYTTYISSLITNPKDYRDYSSDEKGYNEIIVDNWKPISLVYVSDHDQNKQEFHKGVSLAKTLGVPIIDIYGKNIQVAASSNNKIKKFAIVTNK